MAAQGVLALMGARKLTKMADVALGLTLDGIKGSVRPFDEENSRGFVGHGPT